MRNEMKMKGGTTETKRRFRMAKTFSVCTSVSIYVGTRKAVDKANQSLLRQSEV